MLEYEKFQELQAKSQRMQEDYDRQLAELEEKRERDLQEMTEHYENKLQELNTKLEQVSSVVCSLAYVLHKWWMLFDGKMLLMSQSCGSQTTEVQCQRIMKVFFQ